MTSLQQIRERDERTTSLSDIAVLHDRRYLLSLVERMRPFLQHIDVCEKFSCVAGVNIFTEPCTCGLDALLEELR